MLLERYGRSGLAEMLLPVERYHPFPTADEREAWDSLSEALRQAAIREGEDLLGRQWPALPASLYMDFSRTGERRRYEGPYLERRSALGSLVIAECAEGKGRFLDEIINGVWAMCEESSWVIPAHSGAWGGHRPLPDAGETDIDLFAAETASLLAWTHYLLASRLDAVADRVCARIGGEVRRRMLDPFLARDDFWWMGLGERKRLNNWSPWICSNCLSGFLLLEEDGERRAAAVLKAMGILDRFLASYHPDGGCDEGPSYWTVAGASLFDCLELLRGASEGKINVYGESLVQEIGRYIYRAHISGDYFVDFADAPAKVHLPAGLVHRYGRRIEDGKMQALASSVYREAGSGELLGGSLLRVLPNLFDSEGIEAPARPPHVRDVWLDGIQVMAAREQAGSDRGLYLAVKGGHNDESHNHNDVGHYIVYSDGEPVLIDVGVGTYTAKTFSDQRYEIWTMQSAYHNLPTVNGVQQGVGEEFGAADVRYEADDERAELSLDIAGAYPKAAGIESWRRRCRLVRGREARVEVSEEFKLSSPTRDLALSLMTPCEVTLEAAGKVTLRAGDHSLGLTYDGQALAATAEAIELDDESLRATWGDRLFRVTLKPKAPVGQGAWSLALARR